VGREEVRTMQITDGVTIATADGRRLHLSADSGSDWPFTIGCTPDSTGRGFAISLTAIEFERLLTLMDRVGESVRDARMDDELRHHRRPRPEQPPIAIAV
jgi:hypothetical protein